MPGLKNMKKSYKIYKMVCLKKLNEEETKNRNTRKI